MTDSRRAATGIPASVTQAMGDGDKALSRYMTALPTLIHGQKTSATLASRFARLIAQAIRETSAHQRAACMKGLLNIFFA